jgi:hypothetical protein
MPNTPLSTQPFHHSHNTKGGLTGGLINIQNTIHS